MTNFTIPERKNYLLVIGIDKYSNTRFNTLYNAVYDAQRIADILTKKYDFALVEEPLLNHDATRDKIINSLNNLIATIGPEDNLVIYFAGHGEKHSITGHGYWIPYDGSETISSYIPNSTIKDAIAGIEAKHIFLVSDSCYSGTFLTRTRSPEEVHFYNDLDEKKSRWVFASGGEEKVSDGYEPNKGSPFCNLLVTYLDNNTNKNTAIVEIVQSVSFGTTTITTQQPMGAHFENVGHEGGQMVFRLKDEYVKDEVNESFTIEKQEALPDKLQYSTGKEILLIKSFVDGIDYLVVELFRFDDDGDKKNIFAENIVKPAKAGNHDFDWELVQRFATWKGFERYINENPDFEKNNKISIINAREDIEDVENTPAAKNHHKKLQQLNVANTTPMTCLHCGKAINSKESLFVEIDEKDFNEALGMVHKTCLRSADRILGLTFSPEMKENSALINFDFLEWVNLYERGQGFLNAVKKSNYGVDTPIIGWNPDHKFNYGNYCIKLTAEDGKNSYVHLGREIHRIKEADIDKELEFFKRNIDKGIKDNDPFCVTSEKRIFGNRSKLAEVKEEQEQLLKIISVDKATYSNQIAQIKKNIDNDYAPICLVIDPVDSNIINLSNCVPLISDPLKFDELHKSWNEAGYSLGPCELRIIKSDSDLDHYLRDFLDDGMQPIMDPQFNKSAVLTKGYYFADYKELVKRKSNGSN